MNAPLNNLNAMTTGLRSGIVDRSAYRYSMPNPRLPKRYRKIDERVDGYRVELEDKVAEANNGVVKLGHADTISAACDHERARQFLYARLRDCERDGERQPLPVVANVMSTISRIVDARRRCVKELKLDVDPADLSRDSYLKAISAPWEPITEPSADESEQTPTIQPERVTGALQSAGDVFPPTSSNGGQQ